MIRYNKLITWECAFSLAVLALFVYGCLIRTDDNLSRLLARSLEATVFLSSFLFIALSIVLRPARILRLWISAYVGLFIGFVALHGFRAGYLTPITYKASYLSMEPYIWISMIFILCFLFTKLLASWSAIERGVESRGRMPPETRRTGTDTLPRKERNKLTWAKFLEMGY